MHILRELVAPQEALLAEDVELERQLEQRAQGQPLVTLVGIRGAGLWLWSSFGLGSRFGPEFGLGLGLGLRARARARARAKG